MITIIISVGSPLIVSLILYLINIFYFHPKIKPELKLQGFDNYPDNYDTSKIRVAFRDIIFELNNISPFNAYNFNLRTSLNLDVLSNYDLFSYQDKVINTGQTIILKFTFGSHINKSESKNKQKYLIVRLNQGE
jgi:hypothetical protein